MQPQPALPSPSLNEGLLEGICSPSGARQEGEGCSSWCLLSQDEYMADLYHFSTKEDSYASYFIRVSSPLSM